MMLWTVCGCGPGAYHRVHRAWWMRWFFPARRLYQCADCEERAFLPQDQAALPGADAPPPLQARRRTARTVLARLLLGSVLAGLAAIVGVTWWGAASHPSGVAATGPASGPSGRTCHRIHVFQEGETLESIARDELGAEWRWQDIVAANPGLIDRQMLHDKGFEPGMQLQLPVACQNG